MAKPFQLAAPFPLAGNQAQAVEKLVKGFEAGVYAQTLLGVTGWGKTFTVAKTIAALNRPALLVETGDDMSARRGPERFQGGERARCRIVAR